MFVLAQIVEFKVRAFARLHLRERKISKVDAASAVDLGGGGGVAMESRVNMTRTREVRDSRRCLYRLREGGACDGEASGVEGEQCRIV